MKATIQLIVCSLLISTAAVGQQSQPELNEGVSITQLRLDMTRPGRYARSFVDVGGQIHLMGVFKIIDQGTRVVLADDSDPKWNANLGEAEINTIFCRQGLFIGLNNRIEHRADGVYACQMWRSTDNLTTISEEETILHIPEAGRVDYGDGKLWAGLFLHSALIELSDGSLLAAAYGNFEQDTARPTHPWSKTESKYKLRAFAVRSTDDGKSWSYLSSLAVPDQEIPDGSEGFNEWTVTMLEDGRLLAIIRTGHFTPMVACWSSDEGRSWTSPQAIKQLGPAGVDPCLIRLRDGRLALAYGEMVQPPEDRETYWQDFAEHGDRRRRCRLAISQDKTGHSWKTIDISGYDNRSAYPSIFEVEDNVLLYQADLELWQVKVR